MIGLIKEQQKLYKKMIKFEWIYVKLKKKYRYLKILFFKIKINMIFGFSY